MESLLKKMHWFIIAYAVYLNAMYVLDAQEKLKNISDQQTTVEQELLKQKSLKKKIISYSKEIDDVKTRIELVAREIERNQQLLPSEISDNENISLVRSMAEDLNIKEMNFMAERDDDRGFFIARRYKFKAKATYLQLLMLMEKISDNKKILNITDLVFKKLDQPQRSKFQLIDGEFGLEAYKYNTKYKEDRGIEEIEKSFKEEDAAGGKKGKKAKKQTAEKEE